MPVGLYMDEHAPKPITDELRIRGVDVLRAQEDVPEGTSDTALLNRSIELQRLLFSYDDDFLVEAAQRQREDVPFSGVAYAHPLRVSIGQCVRDLELLAKASKLNEVSGRVIHLPL